MHGRKMLICALGGLALCVTARGAEEVTDVQGTDLPYQEIVSRNVFALKPLPPPPGPEDTKPPPSKITLTGISSVTKALVFMKTPPPTPKPGEPLKPGETPKERFYMLHAGERDGDIEVLEIDVKTGVVKVNNAGQVETLTFEKNGVKLASTPAPAIPGVPGALPGVPPPPTGMIPPPMKGAGGNPVTPFPVRQIRTPGQASTSPAGIEPAGYGMSAVDAGGVGLPLMGANTTQTTPNQTTPAQPPMSLEQSLVMTEIARQQTAAQVAAGKMPPLPPNPYLAPDPTPNSAPNNSPTVTPPPRPPGFPQLPPMPQLPGH